MSMNAAPASLMALISGQGTRYVIPVYQRPYSWDEENCDQLWQDVLSIGRRLDSRHFTGSVVYVMDGAFNAAGITTALLIDGQQRMTTVTLLLAALADFARAHADQTYHFSYEEIIGAGYLVNPYKKGEDHYKLTLSQGDKATLKAIVDAIERDDVELPQEGGRLVENFNYFRKRIELIEDPNVIWDGVQRLDVVAISLDAGKDNPQLIFESMNSTGKGLSNADLIRNYVLMGLDREEQDQMYLDHWRKIEEALGEDSYNDIFDNFISYWLAVLRAPEPLARGNLYNVFKRYVVDNGYDKPGRIVGLLKQMETFADYYARIKSGAETEPRLHRALDTINRQRADVINPFLMSLYQDYNDGAFDMDDFVAMVELTECFLFRRAVVDAPTNSLTNLFLSLMARLNRVQDEGGNYREAYESYLFLEAGTARRFPTDAEFAQALETRDAYHFRRSFYMLSELENVHHSKDPLALEPGTYTIEHIMPQNGLNVPEWADQLTEEEQENYEALCNNLGNLTLTAYNSELSDGTFAQKKERIVGGYDKEYLVISKAVHDADSWGTDAIRARAKQLTNVALNRWPFLSVNAETAEKYKAKSENRGAKSKTLLFKALVEADVIPAGTTLVPTGDKYTAKATVTADGGIRLANGEEFRSPSMASQRVVALSGTTVHKERNGWYFWRVENGAVLDELRQDYLKNALGDEQNETRATRAAFWTGLYEYCDEQPGFTEAFGDQLERLTNMDSWAGFGIGLKQCHLTALMGLRDKHCTMEIYFGNKKNFETFYRNIDAAKADIEPYLNGDEVTYTEIDDDKRTRWFHVKHDVDYNAADWNEIYAWIVEWLWRLRQVALKYAVKSSRAEFETGEGSTIGKYAAITAFAGKMAVDDGDPSDRARGPYTTETVSAFIKAFNESELADYSYTDTLKKLGVSESNVARENIDLDRASLELVVAVITYYVREDYFSNGRLTERALDGYLDKCLKRLKELDRITK